MISKEKNSYLNQQQTHEDILKAQEGIHSIKIKNTKSMILNIALSKAFDRSSWTYLHLILTLIGFPHSFVNGSCVVLHLHHIAYSLMGLNSIFSMQNVICDTGVVLYHLCYFF